MRTGGSPAHGATAREPGGDGARARERGAAPRQDRGRIDAGTVAEWTKATVLKTVDPQGSVGSNPTRSADE